MKNVFAINKLLKAIKIVEREAPIKTAYKKYNILIVLIFALLIFTDMTIETIKGAKETIIPNGDLIKAKTIPVEDTK